MALGWRRPPVLAWAALVQLLACGCAPACPVGSGAAPHVAAARWPLLFMLSEPAAALPGRGGRLGPRALCAAGRRARAAAGRAQGAVRAGPCDDVQQPRPAGAARVQVQEARRRRLQRYQEEAVRHSQLEPAERQQIKIQQAYAMRAEGMRRKQCGRCWMPTGMCVCDAPGGADWPEARGFEHTCIVYLHLKEFTKTSNTGCLLQALGEDRTHILVSGVDAHEARLDQLLAESGSRVLLLFPGSCAGLAN